MALLDSAEGPDDGEMISLDRAPHTLLMGLRMIVVGRAECPVLRRMFVELCGPSGDEALTSLFVIVKLVAFRSRRRLSVHAPGCPAISSDELIFLSALAAAQRPEIEGHASEGLWLSSLIGAEADSALSGSLRALAGLLTAADQSLDMDGCRPAASAHGQRRSLH